MNPRQRNPKAGAKQGFTLVELLIAMAVTLIVLAAAVLVFQKSMNASYAVTQRAEMQENARVAINEIMHDLNVAGTSIPPGGIGVPSGGVPVSRFGCDTSTCYITNNTFGNNVMYMVTPSIAGGPRVINSAIVTDAITMIAVDPNLDWSGFPVDASGACGGSAGSTMVTNGSGLTMPTAVTPLLGDPAVGLNLGDVLLLQNLNGRAVGVVTGFNSAARTITFANGDPLNINQTAATTGNIARLANAPFPPAAATQYPCITVSRLNMVTYFIQSLDANNQPLPVGTTIGVADSRLMRQLGARAPVPVAEHIENLQVSYDVFDDNTATATANIKTFVAPRTPQQIRKINIAVTVRAPRVNFANQFDRVSFSTSVSPRNLSYYDRYQ